MNLKALFTYIWVMRFLSLWIMQVKSKELQRQFSSQIWVWMGAENTPHKFVVSNKARNLVLQYTDYKDSSSLYSPEWQNKEFPNVIFLQSGWFNNQLIASSLPVNQRSLSEAEPLYWLFIIAIQLGLLCKIDANLQRAIRASSVCVCSSAHTVFRTSNNILNDKPRSRCFSK